MTAIIYDINQERLKRFAKELEGFTKAGTSSNGLLRALNKRRGCNNHKAHPRVMPTSGEMNNFD